MEKWDQCKKILCIRLDNMGDVIMSSPAIRALKQSFNCRITLLTSRSGAAITGYLPGIDDVMIFDAPWMKKEKTEDARAFNTLVAQIRSKQFDAAVIFTVFSQSPLPAAMLAYLAGIPLRLAYCRENPYQLLTHWIPEEEPYDKLQHQVSRDLKLVNETGAGIEDDCLRFKAIPGDNALLSRLQNSGIRTTAPWLIFHPGVSEEKRRFDTGKWIEAGRLSLEAGYQLVITGSAREWQYAEQIRHGIGKQAVNMAGSLSTREFIQLIHLASLIVTVNTGASHIAAAAGTPMIVLYALSNPQHLPWKAKGKVLLFDIPAEFRSRNSILRFTQDHIHPENLPAITAHDILAAIKDVSDTGGDPIPDLIPGYRHFQHSLQA